MPLYPYVCKNENCKNHDWPVDIICKLAERNDQVCETCNDKLDRLVTAPRCKHGSWSRWQV